MGFRQFWTEFGDTIAWGSGARKLGGLLSATGRDHAMNLGQFQDGEESFKTQSQLFVQKTSLDEGVSITVPQGYNAVAYGEYTVNGELTINGEMSVLSLTE